MLLLITVGWFVLPRIWGSIALVLWFGTNLMLDARRDRRYLREARARDLAEGSEQ